MVKLIDEMPPYMRGSGWTKRKRGSWEKDWFQENYLIKKKKWDYEKIILCHNAGVKQFNRNIVGSYQRGGGNRISTSLKRKGKEGPPII